MSSGPERDMIDYIEPDPQHEDNTLFLPLPSSKPDSWTVFNIGILTGIAGGVLLAVVPWLAGSLIFSGYGLAALTLKARYNRLVRALRLGFGLSSLYGAAILGGAIYFPDAIWRLIVIAGERHLLFPVTASLPWAIGISRYVYALLRREKHLA